MKKETKQKIKERHKLLLKEISKNIKSGITLEKAMLKAGYSKSYAKTSTHLKDTKSWQKLLETYLSDEDLAKKHNELLNKKEIIIINQKRKKFKIIKTGQPHSDVKSAIDMGYKLKGKYSPEEINMKFKGFTKEQLISSIMDKITNKK